MDCIHDLVHERARANPDAVAILAPGRRGLTYQGLSRQIVDVIEQLRRDGVGRGDRVATVLPDGAETAVAMLGVAAGAVCAPLNPAYPAGELEAYLRALGAKVLIAPCGQSAHAVAAAETLGMRVLELHSRPDGPAGAFSLVGDGGAGDLDRAPAAPDDTALLLMTSGTSARPKLVPLSHRNLCVAARNICGALELAASDRCLGVMPLFHIHALSTLYATVLSGGCFVIPAEFSAAGFVAALQALRPTWYSASPTIHRAVLEQVHLQTIDARQSGLRFIRSASAPMPAVLVSELESGFGVPVIEAYGMTEAAPQIASNRLPPFARKPGSVGRAAGPDVAVMDERGQFLQAGETGEVVIRGANVIRGYANDSKADEAAFVDGWLRTGDLGYLDADGYLFITGRLKEIINRGGEKVAPRMVEEVIQKHPAVAQAVVFAIPHAVLGENVAAAVVLKPAFKAFVEQPVPGVDPSDQLVRSIRAFVTDRLAHFEVPQQIVLLDAIPLGPTGKLNRNDLARTLRLAESDGREVHAAVDATAPRTAAERKLANVFAEVLGAKSVGIHQDFFELGGHSLTAAQVVARVQQAFQFALPADCLFERPTVAKLAELVGQRMSDLVADGAARLDQQRKSGAQPAAKSSAIGRRQASGPVPLSFAQQRVYFLDQLGAGSAYYMSASLRLTGLLDVRALSLSLDEIVRRHEALRTTFELKGAQPVQVVAPTRAEELTVADLGSLPERERSREADRIMAEEAHRSFDLARGPLFRATLVRLGAEKHLLLIAMHHIVSDGWSVGVLYRELARLYGAFVAGRASPLSDLPLQYGDFAVWQQTRARDGSLDNHVAYWKDRLAEMPPACSFPTDRTRPGFQSYRGAVCRTSIDRPLTARLRALGQDEGATLFMTALAAFKTLLFRYNGQDDCAVGVPIANRPTPETEALIGFFANTLVLRTPLAGDPTFRELLARVRATALGAYAYPDVPLERLVDELRVERDPGRTPLFQVMFAFQNLPDAGSGGDSFELAPNLTARPVRPDSVSAKFDLTLYLAEVDGDLALTWQYNADLFDETTVERIAAHFQTFVEGIASNREGRLSELPLLTEDERRRMQIEWNRTETRRVLNRNYPQLFEAQAKRTPNALAVVCGDEQFTYRELNERANQIAGHLREAGVVTESLVAVCLPRSAELLAVLLGTWKAGGAFLAIDPDYPPERFEFMLRDAGATIVVTEDLCRPELESFADGSRRVICLDRDRPLIAQHGLGNLDDVADPQSLAYVIYTSGSTGRPKGVMITHANVCHYAQAMVEALGIVPGDRYLHTASFGFSSSVRQFVVPLACGAAVVVASGDEARDPHLLFDVIRRRGVSVLDLVPSFGAGCVDFLKSLGPAERSELLDNSLRFLLSASELLPSRLASEWAGLLKPGTRLVNMCGQTETTGIVMTYPVPPDDDDPSAAVVPIGRPIANTQAYVLDASRQIVPIGACGELYIGGAGVGRGYLNQPELTASHFVPNPFSRHAVNRLYRTGDVARYRADGTIELVGRADEQVKVRGFRIEPGEIETILRGCPDVGECFVGAFAGGAESRAGAGKRLIAFLTARADGSSEQLTDRARAYLKSRLPEYMVPQTIVALDRLPRTVSGKVDRAALSARVAQRALNVEPEATESRKSEKKEPPRTGTERILADVWAKVLHLDSVGVDENFFDLGGNSILSINVVVRAKQAGLDLSLSQLYQNQTVAELAKAIDGSGDEIVRAKAAPALMSELVVGREKDQWVPLRRGVATERDGERARGRGQDGSVLVTVESLRAYGREALTRAGLDPRGAEVVTEVQLEASRRGQPTHNMVSIPRYAKRLSTGKLNARPNIRVERETANSAQIDGDNGPGQWVSTVAMDAAIHKAREAGVGMVSVRRSNHFGAAGQYVWQATQAGLIGLCTTNGPLILAPTGGVTPTFGNNPLGVGIPALRHFPILLDIAMSVAPRGKIGLCVAEGKPLPHGWILDRRGRPSTDLADLAAGLGVPIGGHKGYGLALVMEVLAGALTGAGFCADHRREKLHGSNDAPDFGHFFMAIDPERFMPAPEFAARVDRLIEETKGGELAEGSEEILIPGEMEQRARQRSLAEGVRLRRSTYRALMSYAQDAGLRTRLDVISGEPVAAG